MPGLVTLLSAYKNRVLEGVNKRRARVNFIFQGSRKNFSHNFYSKVFNPSVVEYFQAMSG